MILPLSVSWRTMSAMEGGGGCVSLYMRSMIGDANERVKGADADDSSLWARSNGADVPLSPFSRSLRDSHGMERLRVKSLLTSYNISYNIC